MATGTHLHREAARMHVCMHGCIPALFCSFTPFFCLPLVAHSEHEYAESASLDTAAEYSAPFFSPPLPSPTLNSPDLPPPPAPTLPPAAPPPPPPPPLPPLSALCAPLSLRGSPLIALHITLNHHNNKSTLSQKSTSRGWS